MLRRIFLVAMLAGVALTVHADTGSTFGVLAAPEASFPIGPRASNYRFSMGGRAEALFGMPAVPFLTPSLEVGYCFAPLDFYQTDYFEGSNLSLLRAGLAGKALFPVGERVSLFGRVAIGGFFAFKSGVNHRSAPGVALTAGGGASLLVSSNLLLDLVVAYQSYLALYDGLSVSLSMSAGLAGPGTTAIPRAETVRTGTLDGYLEFSSIELDRLFPVLYKYYDDHAIGHAVVTNRRSRRVEDVEIRLVLSQFMDAPKVSARIDELKPGESREIEIYALFTEPVLGITEGARIAAELTGTYSTSGRLGEDKEVVTLELYDRNALRWDDDRKIAAFVTARDEEVQRFARNVASIADDEGIAAVERSLQLGMVLFAAMDENRCVYVPDPSSPYAQLSQDEKAVDSVQFPRQTLQYRAGDCDDLSSAYAAMLESVGVQTAFITVPGHIYTAFRLDMVPSDLSRFARGQDLIVADDDSVWIPVETTLLREGFLAAWAEGARQWREYSGDGTAAMFKTSDAWLDFEPVAFGVADFQLQSPPRNAVATAFSRELNRFVNQEISAQEENLLSRLRERSGDVRIHNRLGVLYARYGMTDKASEQLSLALQYGRFVPALVNLGNLAFLDNKLEEADSYYRQALQEEPENTSALLGVARVAYEMENYAAAEGTHARLSEIAPELAERFAYLGSGIEQSGRAANAMTVRRAMVWEESE